MDNAEICKEQQRVFDEMFTVQDILKGDNIAMMAEAREIAIKNLKLKENEMYQIERLDMTQDGMMLCGLINKELLGTIIDVTITEIYQLDDDHVEIYTERTPVTVLSVHEILNIFQKELEKPKEERVV